jgi:hypothetical protein
MKTLKIIFILSFNVQLLLGLNNLIFSQTYISGILSSNTTWTLNNSPYIVTGNTVLLQGLTLTIDPGVVIKFDSSIILDMRGTLIALGTSTDSIYFLPSGNSKWNGIKINNSLGAKANLHYCRFIDSDRGFHIFSSTGIVDTVIQLRNCYFANNYYVIDQDDIIKSYHSIVDSCFFIKSALSQGASNCIVLNSVFADSSGMYNSAQQNTIIDNCEFYNDAQISVIGIITNSKIHNNRVGINTMSNSTSIHNCDIYDNEIGIKAWNYQVSNPITQITNNRICHNTINIKKIYDSDTYVINNCWCLTDSVQIGQTMYDFFDDSNLGIIFYSPFDTSCINPNNINKNEIVPNLLVYPNPTSDKIYIHLLFNKTAEIILVDNTGRICYKSTFLNTLTISTKPFENGMYFYLIKTNNEIIKSGKLIFQ